MFKEIKNIPEQKPEEIQTTAQGERAGHEIFPIPDTKHRTERTTVIYESDGKGNVLPLTIYV
jgi:hypothetical protein